MELNIKNKNGNDIEDLPFELVERKGIGHPDTICDAIAETASRYYALYFYEKYGRVANHWFDKVMLIGGESDIGYGVGTITKPYKILFVGKGARTFAGENIPLTNIFHKAASDVLSKVSTGFDQNKHRTIVDEIVDYQGAGRRSSRYKPLSIDDLTDIESKELVSNDSNLLSSYAPLSKLEQLVLYTEHYINGSTFKQNNPDTGWDVKVFGSRCEKKFKLLVNVPFLGSYINSLDHYFERKAAITKEIYQFITSTLHITTEITLNATDKNGAPYLTAIGSVADTGDCGVVGRGNRINGLITPMRTMSIEAPAGKNPLDHTGKLYGILSRNLANDIYNVIGKPVEVHIFTSKESNLNNPDEVSVRIQDWVENDVGILEIKKIINDAVSNVGQITKELIFNGITMW
jgi:S-adenosylmethionine synthetase